MEIYLQYDNNSPVWDDPYEVDQDEKEKQAELDWEERRNETFNQ